MTNGCSDFSGTTTLDFADGATITIDTDAAGNADDAGTLTLTGVTINDATVDLVLDTTADGGGTDQAISLNATTLDSLTASAFSSHTDIQRSFCSGCPTK